VSVHVGSLVSHPAKKLACLGEASNGFDTSAVSAKSVQKLQTFLGLNFAGQILGRWGVARPGGILLIVIQQTILLRELTATGADSAINGTTRALISVE
jgi:hypothetical protein